ncbi:uncharacterized protein LOC115921221 [Strongylocentrotus purpuratus]|uniref:Uncharacterized protein n=1 Tax=Strongylocentrotus purpuratus TaxID=7668 RepID=A0A7M7NFQ7_STRPU|nr:uncharacterized protein LOC115921221 [Strongylocentrotus purpuratus]
MNKQLVAKVLGATISDRQVLTYHKLLHQKGSKWKSPTEWSNGHLDAGFYDHAHEFMAVSGHETETRNVASEELCQEGIAINEPAVMQEKSRDGAAESKEKTTENVDTKEQGNAPDGSDECKQDESSKLLIQAQT